MNFYMPVFFDEFLNKGVVHLESFTGNDNRNWDVYLSFTPVLNLPTIIAKYGDGRFDFLNDSLVMAFKLLEDEEVLDGTDLTEFQAYLRMPYICARTISICNPNNKSLDELKASGIFKELQQMAAGKITSIPKDWRWV